ncbi:MAG TPA: carbohydrate-binding domain-containing protein [Bacillota bacterium]|nr:carbohydrate-binding domain-containing protein [Bacillota bacterium]HOK69541.1 carbohydrate-binding domain-containing protein [Bacillota bacterium]
MKKRLRSAFALITALSLLSLSACAKNIGSGPAISAASTDGKNTDKVIDTTEDVTETKKDIFQSGDGLQDGFIALSDSGIAAGEGVTVSGNTATIRKAGSYTVSGASSDAQIVIDVGKEDKVELILNGVDIACKNSAPIYAKKSKILILTLAEGATNQISDGSAYSGASNNEPNAAIFSKDDITIKGKGSLTVNAHYENGISTSNDLKIIGGNLAVISKNTALRGKDSVKIGLDANITVNSGGDAVKSSNDTESGLGVILITGGAIQINSGEDGLEAVSGIVIKNGDFDITTGSGQQVKKNTSYKAIKCDRTIRISGGNFVINSADDAIHSNENLFISGGTFAIASNDDGIHADASVTISGGSITIQKSYEGIEGRDIAISGGEIRITASDDGINCAGGNDTGDQNRPGKDRFQENGDSFIDISGGIVVIDAAGDGVDANGNIHMSGGTLLVCGPTDDKNGAIDYDGVFIMTGGLLVAAGSSGMARSISAGSTQYGLLAGFDKMPAGTLVRIEDSSGNDVITFQPHKPYSSIAVSAPAFQKGETYKILFGGTCDGTLSDGLYSGGNYAGGSEYASFTVSSVLTIVGDIGRGGMDRPGDGPGGGPGGGGRFGRP